MTTHEENVVTPDSYIVRGGPDAELDQLKKVADMVNAKGRQPISFTVFRPRHSHHQLFNDVEFSDHIEEHVDDFVSSLRRFCGELRLTNKNSNWRNRDVDTKLHTTADVHFLLEGNMISLDHAPWDPDSHLLEIDVPKFQMMLERRLQFFAAYKFNHIHAHSYTPDNVREMIGRQLDWEGHFSHRVEFSQWTWPVDRLDQHLIVVAVIPRIAA